MKGQMSIFDFLIRPGDWLDSVENRREMTFDECVNSVGKMILVNESTESHEWYKAMVIESVTLTPNGRRLVCYDGERQRALLDEMFFNRRGKLYE
jgi:hypothetical protein